MKPIRWLLILLLTSISFALQGDYCDDPFVIDSLPVASLFGYTTGFSNDFSMGTSCTGHTTNGPDVVYEYFTGPVSGSYTAFFGPMDPFNGAIYVLSDCNGAVCVAGSDMFGTGSPEVLNFTMPAYTTFWVVIDGRESIDAGRYQFGLNGPPCSAQEGSADFGSRASVQVNPNPFRGITEIEFSLTRSEPVDIVVYSKNGTLVRDLAHGVQSAGGHSLTWDGTDDGGVKVAEGIYFLRLRTEEREIVRTIVFMK